MTELEQIKLIANYFGITQKEAHKVKYNNDTIKLIKEYNKQQAKINFLEN